MNNGQIKTTRVLLVEDNPEDVLLLQTMFRKERPGSFQFTHLTRMQDAESHLAQGDTDIVLLDLGLPDGQGIDVVRRARAAAPDVPLIVLTGLDDETLVAEAMKAGAQDYLIKGQVENRALPRALRYAIERHCILRETELIRKQQMQIKDDFLSHVSHELRSPLTAIYQFSSAMADGLAGATAPEQTEYLEVILRNVKHLQSMIDDLLEVTRAGAGKLGVEPRSMSVSDAVDYTLATLKEAAKAKGVTLCPTLAQRPQTVLADPTRVRQILLILCDNAIKFTPPGGTVTIQVREADGDPSFARFEVADTGCGIDPALSETIFERLYQAPGGTDGPRKGLGLGLHIARELVVRQGGRIWVSSQPGRGATFSFTLPVESLSRRLTPLLRERDWPADQGTLLTVAVCPRNGSLGEAPRQEWSGAARDQLRRFLRHDLDFVLPDTASQGPREKFFVLAFADEPGAAALARRIREQFALVQSNGRDLAVEVSCHSLRWPPIAAGATAEGGIESIAARVEDCVRAEATAGRV